MSPSSVKTFPNAGVFDPDVVRTYFLDFEDADWEKTREEIEKAELTFPTLRDLDGKIGEAYGQEGLPFTVIIDRDGIVRAELRGWGGEEALHAALRKAGG